MFLELNSFLIISYRTSLQGKNATRISTTKNSMSEQEISFNKLPWSFAWLLNTSSTRKNWKHVFRMRKLFTKFNRLNDFIREQFDLILKTISWNIEMNFEFIFCTFKLLLKYIQAQSPDSFCGTLLCTTSMKSHEGECVVPDSSLENSLIFSWSRLCSNDMPTFPNESPSNIRENLMFIFCALSVSSNTS